MVGGARPWLFLLLLSIYYQPMRIALIAQPRVAFCLELKLKSRSTIKHAVVMVSFGAQLILIPASNHHTCLGRNLGFPRMLFELFRQILQRQESHHSRPTSKALTISLTIFLAFFHFTHLYISLGIDSLFSMKAVS